LNVFFYFDNITLERVELLSQVLQIREIDIAREVVFTGAAKLLFLSSITMTAKTTHENFVFMKLPVAQTVPVLKSGNIEPIDVFHPAATLTNEMMVLIHVGFEANGGAIHRDFANQSGQRHRMQALINRCQRGPGSFQLSAL
jgi:hypothetical protein